MPADAPAAFFSYCREDSDFALRLAGDLKAAGANVWMDQLDIEPGMPWDREVEDALANCARLLVILSPVSVKSDNVRDEVSFALSKQKRVVPVLYRECEVPFRLARLQHIDFRTDYARGLKALLKVLGVDQPPQPVAPAQPEATEATKAGQPAVLDGFERQLTAEHERILNERRVAVEQAVAEVERRAAEQARLEEERKQAVERARLEQEQGKAAEKARLEQEERGRLATLAAAEKAQLEQKESERKQAVEQARLEQERRASQERVRQEEIERQRIAAKEQRRLEQEGTQQPTAPGPALRSQLPVWGKAVIGSCGILIIALLIWWASRRPSSEQAAKAQARIETIGATASGPSNRSLGVTLIIYQYSTPEDRQILVEAFQRGSNIGLVNALGKLKAVGHLSMPGTLGLDVSYISAIPTSTGRKIRFITNRQLMFGEEYTDSPSHHPNLTAGEFELSDQDMNKSTGVLYPTAQLGIDADGQLSINPQGDPWRLGNVTDRGRAPVGEAARIEAIDASTMQFGKSFGISLVIYQYSTPADRSILVDAFRKGSNQGLLNALGRMKAVGHLSMPGTLGLDVSYVNVVPTSTGRKILFVTNRQLLFGEAYPDSPAQRPGLTAGEIDLNDQDMSKSTGLLYPTAQFGIDGTGQLSIDPLNLWRLSDIIDWKGTPSGN
ncbi:MAG TPA: TIR domain-containing protein [Terracidiphilus sp.]|nr:TIR domain-containing protein [Terracidiphilus sp.]